MKLPTKILQDCKPDVVTSLAKFSSLFLLYLVVTSMKISSENNVTKKWKQEMLTLEDMVNSFIFGKHALAPFEVRSRIKIILGEVSILVNIVTTWF